MFCKATSQTLYIYFAESHWVGQYVLAERDGLLFVLDVEVPINESQGWTIEPVG
jgi:hypothetical protein